MPTRTSTIRFHLERSSFWQPATPGAIAEIPEVPLLLRRRASEADRAALRVAFDCTGPKSQFPAVFCSRHGEVARSVELLEQLAKGEPLSPMTFSLSVHNAAATLFSISQGNTAPMNAIAAGRDSLAMGMIDAVAQLEAGAEKVLVVVYDAALPETFQRFKDEDDAPYGLGLLLSKTEGPGFSLELEAGGEAANSSPQALLVAKFLAGGEKELKLASAPRQWVWRRDA